MTETQIQTAITETETAISNMLKVGQEYEVGTGASRRRFIQADLDILETRLFKLESKLSEIQGNSGTLLGF